MCDTIILVIKMIIRKNYLDRLVSLKDTELIKIITGIRRSGKSYLLLMFKEYLLDSGVLENDIIHINFESAEFDEVDDYKKLIKYVKKRVKKEKFIYY